MKKISLDEKKEIMLQMLCELDSFCKKNKINYYLTGGTLLGAIRHNGYIPWDDDIDVCLLRQDYDKLVSSFKSISGHLSLLDPLKTKRYIWPFSKLVDNRTILIENKYKSDSMGVFIDVFPMDNLPGDFEKSKEYTLKVNKIKNMLTLKYLRVDRNRSFFKNFLVVFGKLLFLIPDPFFIKKIDKMCRKYQNSDCEYICNLCGAWGAKEITKKEYFLHSIEHVFEGMLFRIPLGFDEYLKGLYGNYMTLPPIERRKTHHTSVEYWKDY